MEYVMIERSAFDALARSMHECCVCLEEMKGNSCKRSEKWIDNAMAKEILHRSSRTMQNLRSSGRLGYSIIDGKVLYPESEISRLLKDNYHSDG